MKYIQILLIVLFTAGLSLANADQPKSYFNDYVGSIVTTEQADVLNAKLSDLEKKTGTQFIVAVYPSLDGQVLENFTIQKCKEWQLGQKGTNNGLGLFIFKNDRKMRFEVGYGLEGNVTDAKASSIIRNDIAPYFKQGNFFGGVNAGVDATIALLDPPLVADASVVDDGNGGNLLIVILIVLGVVGVGGVVLKVIEANSYSEPIYTPPHINEYPSPKPLKSRTTYPAMSGYRTFEPDVTSTILAASVLASASSTPTKKKKKSSDDDSYTSRSSSSSSSDFGGGGGGDFGGGGSSGSW